MRLFKKFSEGDTELSFAGSLLIAHPSQFEGYFKRTVVLMIVHSTEDGSLGLILNRPLHQKLADYSAEFSDSRLASVPLFDGGPVSSSQLILVAWKQDGETGALKLYFGIDESKALEIIANDPEFELRGFLGYAGWSEGQLEGELKTDAWVLTELSAELSELDKPKAWNTLLASQSPEMRLLAGEPQDPSLN
jgi:putative transcriptional regulator